jgi:GMP synthase (glutamine-hydrolysing)
VRVLSVTHGPSVPGGVFDEAVQAAGHVLERWSVPDGTKPDPAESYGAVMVFGGSMHPDQDDRFGWLASEEEFLRDVLSARIPVFGVCLGAQMLARAAGGTVKPAHEPEIGWLTCPHPRRDELVLRELRRRRRLQHHYTLEIPPGGTELARSEARTQVHRRPAGLGASSSTPR